MHLSDFDYELPPGLIAQEPIPERGGSRLLRLDRRTGQSTHHTVADLPSLLAPGDLLVVNDTRVYPARLLGHRVPSGGEVECLLLSRLDDERWEALVHPGQKLKERTRAVFKGAGYRLELEVLARRFQGRRTVRLTATGADIETIIDAIGHVPLPPYIKRADHPGDRERYQTVYARERGSVAAPTAGLHFTTDLFDALDARGVTRTAVTLHVGYGTFQPIRSERVEEHTVGTEPFEITPPAAQVINAALDEGRRIVAVGTTSTRVLETAVRQGDGLIAAGSGLADLYIYPGFDFRAVGALMTNLHLPRSSLLVLVCAFAGREPILAAYTDAIAAGYRFYSYGDAMLIV
ncbi:MAG: tRNA preQ1(34) S-adenosylmethionine ribosyltransferase-isomerase QueA [Vicinamibacterales bacterium]